jgi:asparagine synthase (glutamine-hydrolysing)
MCGFAGVINGCRNISEHQIFRMACRVAFRGPDNTGVSIYDDLFQKNETGNNAFFFNRLAILDLDHRSNQPFEDERYTLLFNGEIYNYISLKKELENKGVVFHTSSDTEVLFQGLIHYGKNFIIRLNGMFAFAFIDRQEQSFILARDRMGIKPLCYSIYKNSLLFGSEADSIVRLLSDKPDLSKEAIDMYLAFQYVPTPYTIWKNIFKLPPGCILEGCIKDLKSSNTILPQSYWKVWDTVRKQNGTGNDLEALLTESICSQLQSDVPLGLFLSSGVDSSLLAAIINKHFRDEKFNFFTVAFEQKTISDESSDAEQFLKGFDNPNFIHHKLFINPISLQQSILQMYDYIDEPFGDSTVVLNHGISKKAREYVTVALSGDGADELFWGYPRYDKWIETKSLFTRNKMIKNMDFLFNIFPNRLKRKLKWITETDSTAIYLYMMTSKLGNIYNILFEQDLWGFALPDDLRKRKDLPSVIDMTSYLPDCMFYKVDRSSMGCSLEVRVPYLDNSIIDYGLTMPLTQKSTNSFTNKAPLKELLLKLAPHYDSQRPKKGFNFPLKEWIGNEWKDLFYSVITKNNLLSVGLESSLIKLLDEHYSGKRYNTTELWYLFNLLHWKDSKKI